MIVGFTGFKGCGKDTAAAFAPYVKIYKFADPLKAMLGTFLKFHGYTADDIWECLEGDLKEEAIDPFMGQTSRWAMQSLGTEWGRQLIHPDLWLNTMEARLAAKKDREVIAVTDVRFLNEAKLIFKMGGKLIRISRPGNDPDLTKALHPSESEMQNIIPSTTIVNDGTVEDLRRKVTSYLKV